jgi:hypothetical protein
MDKPGLVGDRLAHPGHTGRVGQREVVAITHRDGASDLELATVVERVHGIGWIVRRRWNKLGGQGQDPFGKRGQGDSHPLAGSAAGRKGRGFGGDPLPNCYTSGGF